MTQGEGERVEGREGEMVGVSIVDASHVTLGCGSREMMCGLWGPKFGASDV